ncbi:hypothetical protein BHE97_17470 [Aeromicrobium sp. PE09-221]|uniref:acyltransferase family protein n=1 Tax=Aeromicrobium sp. PE09-221 TaxID=1898043 RepID=UPI000B3E676B|nr:acyltransferase family protein [Aeromicrobium sp. PE09-221]OUZ07290.1 hypothetical protein BHE97_17470 [Aeromicrobium sp. PE09-221]
MSATDTLERPGSKASSDRIYRPEIEGLRALAALLVAIWHIWVGGVSGGVDVFFVVSGFLITTTLLGHIDRFGRVRPFMFLGRLLRRLLPPALVVLVVVLVATWVLVPEALRDRSFREIFASALYFENWQLAFSAVDYLDQNDPHTPVQHFWAMSVQGQFYVTWAVIFLLASAVALKLRRKTRSIAAVLLVIIALLSFAYSVWFTAVNQPFSYFSAFSRGWEFAVGAMTAFVLARVILAPAVSWLLGWTGLAAVLLCGVLLPVATSFPGYVALWPVAGATLILFAGGGRDTPGHATWLLSRPTMVWLGGLSYGIYLWHWPLLILYRHESGSHDVGPVPGALIIGSSVVLAWLTVRLVENPFQIRFGGTTSGRRIGTTLLLLGVLVVAAASLVSARAEAARADQRQAEAESRLMDDADCFGAEAALRDAAACEPDADLLVPTSAGLLSDTGGAYACYAAADDVDVTTCAIGSEQPDALRIALVGNSHAAMMIPALEPQLEERNWHIDTFTGNGCVWGLPASEEACGSRMAQMEEYLLEAEPYDVLLATSGNPSGRVSEESIATTLDAWEMLEQRGTQVVVIEDNPRLPESVADCVVASSAEELVDNACVVTESEGFAAGDVFVAPAERSDVPVVRTRDLFCRDGECPTVIGNVIVYRDAHHITATYARTLGPILAERLADRLP